MELTTFRHSKSKCYESSILYIITNTNGIVVNENLGSINLPSLKIRSFDWNQKVHWEFFEGKDSLTQIASRLFSSNTTVSYLSHHKDSAYKWLVERFNMYNLDGTKKRVCRYSFLSTHGISLIASTKDNGFVARAKSILWGDTKLGFVKTDSLGLVYNTDIICDCKDFKVEVSEVKVPELNVQVFPNPATAKINVLLSHKQEATITLHNLNGQVVKTQAAEFNSNIFDISELDKGLYFVEVISQNSKIIKKLIVE